MSIPPGSEAVYFSLCCEICLAMGTQPKQIDRRCLATALRYASLINNHVVEKAE